MSVAKPTPGPVVIVAREYVEALDRLEKSKRKLADAQKNLAASEEIVRGSRARFLDEAEAYGVDDGGDPPAAARALWLRYVCVTGRGSCGARAAIAKATGGAA